MNNDFCVTRGAICQWFSLVTSSLVKIIVKSPEWVNWVITGLRYLAFLLLATSHYLNQCCQQFKPFCTKFWEISIIWCQIFSRYNGKSSPMVKYCQKLEGTLRIDQFRKLLNLRRFKSELKLSHWGRVTHICQRSRLRRPISKIRMVLLMDSKIWMTSLIIMFAVRPTCVQDSLFKMSSESPVCVSRLDHH